MQPVGLYDEITVTVKGEGIQLQCDPPDLPDGSANLVWRAARLFQEETGHHLGLKIQLRKRIPTGAGLGGGSSDAAGVLCALNRLHGGGVSKARLAQWATSLGADVPFFLMGTPAVATGIGEKLRPVTIGPDLHYVLVFPGWSISTKWAYENLDLELTSFPKAINIPNLIEHLEDLTKLLHNDLESVTARAKPWIYKTKAKLMDLGASGSLMSGSGPTVFGVFADEDTAKLACEDFRPAHGEIVWLVRGC
jgi:4-diphosphocytidyl-2-C-methyl-D-erythritol kinase